MLEAKIDTLTDTIKELIAALKASPVVPGTAAVTAPAATVKAGVVAKTTPVAKVTPKTLDEVKTAIFAVRDHASGGAPLASEVIKTATGKDKLGEVDAKQYDALHAAAVEKLTELDAAPAAVDESGGL